MPAVEMRGVSKSYRRRGRPPQQALDALDLVVEHGGVQGFLGPNGSGKTTSIRVLLGLIRPDAGEVRLLDRPVPGDLPQVIGSVGALVETPLFFPGFSGRRNLQLLAEVAGLPRTRVEEVLETVELTDRADDRFKGYSLGMKQRLGIAAALLKSPRLLVLDEPSNGLDPAGIRDVRELIRRLGSSGSTTVLLSSHLLAEIEQVCDRVAILARGRCVAAGPVREVLAGRSSGDVRIRVPAPAEAAAVLQASGWAVSPAEAGLVVHAVTAPGEVTRVLAEHGHYLEELTPVAADLESAFLAITAEPV
ncbi:ATP-binding cassette domain-containing protein [Modestobacter sp. I12A-02628]|uniref:ABC transporter ATP-binding protein n=1 Tax=Goekera deserti TaxID=2497753 RepID=A0A7K3WDH1_9ACTN|nr:ABC transporter ATP-binding protein [Goekera deserti]MPQ97141.1 ATP-binding cassette domain-containing protein [Goekera deserti]NDI46541.1 ATP-binding cassette domain-containing protein [Goekera deserti]NEL54525.1 ABC transporter ATP-binding protein [Goekera deserti]